LSESAKQSREKRISRSQTQKEIHTTLLVPALNKPLSLPYSLQRGHKHTRNIETMDVERAVSRRGAGPAHNAAVVSGTSTKNNSQVQRHHSLRSKKRDDDDENDDDAKGGGGHIEMRPLLNTGGAVNTAAGEEMAKFADSFFGSAVIKDSKKHFFNVRAKVKARVKKGFHVQLPKRTLYAIAMVFLVGPLVLFGYRENHIHDHDPAYHHYTRHGPQNGSKADHSHPDVTTGVHERAYDDSNTLHSNNRNKHHHVTNHTARSHHKALPRKFHAADEHAPIQQLLAGGIHLSNNTNNNTNNINSSNNSITTDTKTTTVPEANAVGAVPASRLVDEKQQTASNTPSGDADSITSSDEGPPRSEEEKMIIVRQSKQHTGEVNNHNGWFQGAAGNFEAEKEKEWPGAGSPPEGAVQQEDSEGPNVGAPESLGEMAPDDQEADGGRGFLQR